jgi:hypothetical protein
MNSIKIEVEEFSEFAYNLFQSSREMHYDLVTFPLHDVIWINVTRLELINAKEFIDSSFVNKDDGKISAVDLLNHNIDYIYYRNNMQYFIYYDISDDKYYLAKAFLTESESESDSEYDDEMDEDGYFLLDLIMATINRIIPRWLLFLFPSIRTRILHRTIGDIILEGEHLDYDDILREIRDNEYH